MPLHGPAAGGPPLGPDRWVERRDRARVGRGPLPAGSGAAVPATLAAAWLPVVALGSAALAARRSGRPQLPTSCRAAVPRSGGAGKSSRVPTRPWAAAPTERPSRGLEGGRPPARSAPCGVAREPERPSCAQRLPDRSPCRTPPPVPAGPRYQAERRLQVGAPSVRAARPLRQWPGRPSPPRPAQPSLPGRAPVSAHPPVEPWSTRPAPPWVRRRTEPQRSVHPSPGLERAQSWRYAAEPSPRDQTRPPAARAVERPSQEQPRPWVRAASPSQQGRAPIAGRWVRASPQLRAGAWTLRQAESWAWPAGPPSLRRAKARALVQRVRPWAEPRTQAWPARSARPSLPEPVPPWRAPPALLSALPA